MQIAFSAGTEHLLSAMQACSGGHSVQNDLQYALDQHKALLQHLQEIGRSWPGATKMSEILVRLIEDHLTPLLECKKIHSSNEANFLGAEKGEGSTSCDPSTPSRMPGQIFGRTTTRKSCCAILSIPKASSSISVTDDSTSRTFMPSSPSGESFSVPIGVSCKSLPLFLGLVLHLVSSTLLLAIILFLIPEPAPTFPRNFAFVRLVQILSPLRSGYYWFGSGLQPVTIATHIRLSHYRVFNAEIALRCQGLFFLCH